MCESRRSGGSGMVWLDLQVGKQEGLAARPPASARGLDGHEHSVDLGDSAWVLEAEDPAAARGAVEIQDAQRQSLLEVGTTPSPRLERDGALQSWLPIQIIGVEDQ